MNTAILTARRKINMAEVLVRQKTIVERGRAGRWLANTLLFLLGISLVDSRAFAAEFTISVIDSVTRQPIACRVYIENTITGSRHFVRAHSHLDGVVYERKNWANEKSIEHHTSVPAAPFVAENLPAGSYLITIERGKEYFTETRHIDLKDGEIRPVQTIELRRWVNMAEQGWYSGETHLHRPLNELPVVMQAEDLNICMPLTYWVTKAFLAPSQGNKNQTGEVPERLIEVDKHHVIWPRNTEYEIFTVNEHQHTLGALFVLNHRSVLDLRCAGLEADCRTSQDRGGSYGHGQARLAIWYDFAADVGCDALRTCKQSYVAL